MARFKPYLVKRSLKKYRFLIFIGFLLIILGSLIFLKVQDSNNKIIANNINKLLLKNDFNSCKKINNFSKGVILKNKYIKKDKLLKLKSACLNKFDIKNISYNKDICSLIVNAKSEDFLKQYFLKLNDYKIVVNKCISKYLNLKFSEQKGLDKTVLFDIKYPKNIRYLDNIFLNISIFNNSLKNNNIIIKYSSKQLGIYKKVINLNVTKKSLKDYGLKIKNLVKTGKLNLEIGFYNNQQKLLDKKDISLNILKSPNIGFRILKYGETKKNKSIIDNDFSINKNINIKYSNISAKFYNNSLEKIKDLFNSLQKFKVETSIHDIFLLKSIILLNNLSEKDLKLIGINKNDLKLEKNRLINDLSEYKTDSGMFSLRKHSQIVDFFISAYAYIILNNIDTKDFNLDGLKHNLYYYINDESIPLSNRLDIEMILSSIDKKIDLRFIDSDELYSRHDLITYTYSLFKIGPIINDDLIKININKIKNLLDVKTKNIGYFDEYRDKLLFLNLLLDYKYKNRIYISNLLNNIYSNDFSKINISDIDKFLALNVLVKEYKVYENNDKTRFGFMLGLARNTTKVFWLGGELNSFKEFNYKLLNLLSLGDKKLEFRAKKLFGKDFKVNLLLNGEYENIGDNIKNNKNIALFREIYQKDKTGKYILLSDSDNLKVGLEYKIVDRIRFIDKRPRKNIVIKDFMPSSFEFLSIYGDENKYNYFMHNGNNLEFQYASYWGQDINISYLVKIKNTGKFLDPGLRVFMMFNNEIYGESRQGFINVLN